MRDPLDTMVRLLDIGLAFVPLLSLVIFCFGAYSAALPHESIALYQRLMARFNWDVSPIDARRELRTTRVLGLLLMLLSVVAWCRVIFGGR